MGRSLTELHRCNKVLGVVNGVQPAIGAPAFYHHARCGYEGAEQMVLGRSAGDVTAVIANAPGALELAPSLDYDNGMPWLFLHDTKTNQVTALPAKKNPYEEIYANPAWYGLVPEENLKYLNMQGGVDKDPKYAPRDKFIKSIKKVEVFHRNVEKKYFSSTFIHYGAEVAFHSWHSITWRGDLVGLGLGSYIDDGNGVYSRREVVPVELRNSVSYVKKGVELKPGLSSRGGDGTVPAPSGAAPAHAKVAASFCHGSNGNGELNAAKGYDHQSSYQDSRAQWATLYSIIKIAQLADWHE